ADFAYSPEQNLARLDSAALEFGESIYTLEGTYNLQTQKIAAQLDIPQAYIQDIISVFGWYDLESLTELFQPPDLADADALPTLSLGEKNARVSYLLKLLVIVQQRLQEIAADSDGLALPLDIKGAYTGEINIAGSLNSPILAWEIVGNDWLWDTDGVLVDGIKQEEIIAINQLLVAGNYHDGAIALDSLLLELQQGSIALAGTLNPQQQVTADYEIENFPIDVIDNFVELPLDIAGNISTTGNITGRLQAPELVGDMTLANATLSDRPLPTITGEYTYNNARLELDTTETPSVQILASIPFPIEPTNDRFSLTADLEQGGIALIDGFTGGALQFIGGEGEITLDAEGRLDLNQSFPFQDLDATGEIIFNNTTLKTAAFTEPLNVTADILLANGLLQVEQLTGTLANSPISAAGVLPLLEPRTDISNPLTLVIQESEIDLDQLYEGGIAGEVIITGDAFTPLIGGEVALFDGQVFIPENETEAEVATETEVSDTNGSNEADSTEIENDVDTEINPEDSNEVAVEPDIADTEDTDTESAFNPQLQNLAVALKDFEFEQAPLYQFNLEGDLILNGAATNIPEIRADGTLQLTRADVDFVSSEFNLQRNYNNIIVFDPTESILNPFVDVRLQTEVSELADFDPGIVEGNEIPDPISSIGRNETIDVFLDIRGDAEQIIPRLNEDPDNLCHIEPPLEPLFAEAVYTQEELNQLTQCINANAFAEGSVRELLNSPAVELSSNPPRSQGAILALLGNRFIDLADQLQNSNEEQLLEFGVTQFVITPIEREIFNFADETINDLGEEIGLDYLRIYPALEGTYRVSNDSSVSVTYDYFFNEVKVRYQMQF
ncbi:MAG TPA: translocation/assembly module TamB domain-containing protein, partial [Xenococcaceae cyanobacterium]